MHRAAALLTVLTFASASRADELDDVETLEVLPVPPPRRATFPAARLRPYAIEHGGTICCRDRGRQSCTYDHGHSIDSPECQNFPWRVVARIPAPPHNERIAAAVLADVRRQRPALRHCYDLTRATAAIRVHVAWTITTTGTAIDLMTEAPASIPSGLIPCIVDVVRSIDFGPSPTVSGVRIPFVFRPDSRTGVMD